MPQYVIKQLNCYTLPAPDRPQHCPFLPNLITYGKDTQAPMPTDDSPLLDNAGMKHIQLVVGSFLYYARAVDSTIFMALSNIATQQATPTENPKRQVDQFLYYMWTHRDGKICCRASDMILMSIPMPCISPHLPHAAILVAISSLVAYPLMAIRSNSTAQSILLAPSSSLLLHPLPKLN